VLFVDKPSLVWINGPYEPFSWNDVKTFRNALLSQLCDFERAEAADGNRGESSVFI
jgi:hypothetical protein